MKTKSFWSGLCPELHIEDGQYVTSKPTFNVDPNTAGSLSKQMLVEGYVQLDIPMEEWRQTVGAMSRGVNTLVSKGVMPIFAYVYDEFWLAFFRFHQLIENFLGPYQVLPDFWAWHVDPRRAESGWHGHRDKGRVALLPDGRPKSVTIWIALTQATTLNGCMYIVPADRDPTYNTENEKNHIFKWNDIRALPAEAGTVFFWNQAVFHWGSHASPRAPHPRVSIAMEFQRADTTPFKKLMLPALKLPTFEARLGLISMQILQYQHMYPLPPQLKELAVALAQG